MKKLVQSVFFVSILGIGIVACKKDSFLNKTDTGGLTGDQVFSDSASTRAFLSNIYLNIGFSESPTRFKTNDLAAIPTGGLDAASSEAELPANGRVTSSIQFATGTVGPATVTDDAWKTCYQNIRNVNQLLSHLPTVPVPEFMKISMKAEARFLRAWYYAILVKTYGGVPLVGDTLYTAEDKIPAKRNSFEECVNYIVSECDQAGVDLPAAQNGLDYGRASRGACFALKARLLLYAASPLFNSSNEYNTGVSEDVKPLIGYTTFTPERWKAAADAAQSVITLGAYQLYKDNNTSAGYGFVHLFTMRYNTEYIFTLMRPDNRDLESIWWPPSRGSNGNGAFAYQELADAFGMKDGKAIDDPTANPKFDPADPYANREPRLGYTIVYNQFPMKKTGSGSLVPVNTFVGTGQDQDAVGIGTPTGYYTNKMVDPGVSDLGNSYRCLPLVRYAEVLLNFAEATNEYSGPSALVYQALTSIRDRAGIPAGGDNLFGLKAGMTQDEMRVAIRHERQIELAFEGHWFWDVRRWVIANQTENRGMTGMKITKDGNGNYVYNKFTVRKHNFSKAMYLWPIPQSETGKSAELIQNPWYIKN